MATSGDSLRTYFSVRDWLKLDRHGLKLSQLDRSVLMSMAGFMDPDGSNGRPSERVLSTIVGAHPKSVRRSLWRLKEMDVLEPAYTDPRSSSFPHNGLSQEWSLSTWFLGEIKGNRGAALSERRATGARGKGNRGARKGQPGGGPSDKTDKDRGVNADLSLFEGSSAPPRCPVGGEPMEMAADGSNVCAYGHQEAIK